MKILGSVSMKHNKGNYVSVHFDRYWIVINISIDKDVQFKLEIVVSLLH